MDEPIYVEYDEYKSYSSNDVGERRMERSSSKSLGEGRNEKRNEEIHKEQNEEGNESGDSHTIAKGRCFWWGVDYDLVDLDVGVFVASGHVIACDPWEVVKHWRYFSIYDEYIEE